MVRIVVRIVVRIEVVVRIAWCAHRARLAHHQPGDVPRAVFRVRSSAASIAGGVAECGLVQGDCNHGGHLSEINQAIISNMLETPTRKLW